MPHTRAAVRRPIHAQRIGEASGDAAAGLGIGPVRREPPRVVLRPPVASDREAFLAITNESRAFHAPWLFPPLTASAFAAYLARNRHSEFEARLVCRDDGQIVGAMNLSQIYFGNFRSAYLGYWVGVRHARQAYMTQALRRLLALAFGELKLHRVEANIQPGNAASIGLVKRGGFRLEGFSPRYLKIANRWRDHQRWAALADDWRAARRTVRP